MLSKEYRTIIGGSTVVILVTAILNLLLGFGIALSLSVGIIAGLAIGLFLEKFGTRKLGV